MYLIDTDVLIWVLRGNQSYLELLSNLRNETVLAISTLTIAEIYKNILPIEITRTEALFTQFKLYPVTDHIARSGGLYWKQYAPRFKTLHIFDCLIAATAKEHNTVLVTLNRKHFPMKDIQLFNWVDTKKKIN